MSQAYIDICDAQYGKSDLNKKANDIKEYLAIRGHTYYTGHALRIWICGCSLFYKTKSKGAKGDISKICGFVHPLNPCQRIP